MSEFKGTKGTWNIHNENEIGVLVGSFNPITDICTVHKYGDILEEQANALLISKAPEMLEMLERVSKLRILTEQSNNHPIKEEIQQLIKEATQIK